MNWRSQKLHYVPANQKPPVHLKYHAQWYNLTTKKGIQRDTNFFSSLGTRQSINRKGRSLHRDKIKSSKYLNWSFFHKVEHYLPSRKTKRKKIICRLWNFEPKNNRKTQNSIPFPYNVYQIIMPKGKIWIFHFFWNFSFLCVSFLPWKRFVWKLKWKFLHLFHCVWHFHVSN